MKLTIDEKAPNAETWEHIDNVMRLLARMQFELSRRMFTHDRSKLSAPEVDTFTKFTPKLKGSTYGSHEYNQFLVDMKPALDHHYAHNRHHPEHLGKYFECNGCFKKYGEFPNRCYVCGYSQYTKKATVNQMNLIDILEMLCDWKAASMRHDDGDINRSIEINAKRFDLSTQLISILKNTIPLLDDVFSEFKTQKDLEN